MKFFTNKKPVKAKKASKLMRDVTALTEDGMRFSRDVLLSKLRKIIEENQTDEIFNGLAENARLEAFETRAYLVAARLEKMLSEGQISGVFDFVRAKDLLRGIAEKNRGMEFSISKLLVRWGYDATSLKVRSLEEARKIVTKEK